MLGALNGGRSMETLHTHIHTHTLFEDWGGGDGKDPMTEDLQWGMRINHLIYHEYPTFPVRILCLIRVLLRFIDHETVKCVLIEFISHFLLVIAAWYEVKTINFVLNSSQCFEKKAGISEKRPKHWVNFHLTGGVAIKKKQIRSLGLIVFLVLTSCSLKSWNKLTEREWSENQKREIRSV